jgi:hypothetical protein
MTEPADQARQEVEIRACCGNLRWALLEAVESLPGGAHVGALRWGPAEIPVDVEVGAGPADRAVQSILDAARRRLGSGASCYAGRGALLIDAGRAPPHHDRPARASDPALEISR